MGEVSNDPSSFSRFLETFCKDHHGPVNEGDSLPIRLVPYYLTNNEVEGECIDWTLQYLAVNKCPSLLALKIAQTTADEILASDLSALYEEKNEEEDHYNILASSFGRTVFSKVYEVCERWQQALPDINIHNSGHVISHHAIKNTRRKMEDRHIIIQDLNGLFSLKDLPPQSYYAVFDGHGGVDASTYAAAHVHCNIAHASSLAFDVELALKDGYIKTDTDFVEKARRESFRSGSTGVSVLLREDTMYTAWIGDSQALLVKDGKPIQVMKPHKPERPDEKARIEALGGCVVWFGAWRVNGSLSVSRAIGDADEKPFVSGSPDISATKLDGDEDYIVLACDGMWDTIPNNDLTRIVYDCIEKDKESRENIAKILVQEAKNRGSNDNISVIVVFLRNTLGEPKDEDIVEEEKEKEVDESGDRNSSEKKSENTDSSGKKSQNSGKQSLDTSGQVGDSSSGGSSTNCTVVAMGEEKGIKKERRSKKMLNKLRDSKKPVKPPIESSSSPMPNNEINLNACMTENSNNSPRSLTPQNTNLISQHTRNKKTDSLNKNVGSSKGRSSLNSPRKSENSPIPDSADHPVINGEAATLQNRPKLEKRLSNPGTGNGPVYSHLKTEPSPGSINARKSLPASFKPKKMQVKRSSLTKTCSNP